MRNLKGYLNEKEVRNGTEYLICNSKAMGDINAGKKLSLGGIVYVDSPLEFNTDRYIGRIYLGTIAASATVSKKIQIPCNILRNGKIYLESYNVTGSVPQLDITVKDVQYLEVADIEGSTNLIHPVIELELNVTNRTATSLSIPNFIVSAEVTTGILY